mmetsp:Transcript_16706/g.39673  ORF Transcript_16706/g.39673 Transcript_16706/m.39673 type:complete len:226 (+) Transcript_16706:102-779(+)
MSATAARKAIPSSSLSIFNRWTRFLPSLSVPMNRTSLSQPCFSKGVSSHTGELKTIDDEDPRLSTSDRMKRRPSGSVDAVLRARIRRMLPCKRPAPTGCQVHPSKRKSSPRALSIVSGPGELSWSQTKSSSPALRRRLLSRLSTRESGGEDGDCLALGRLGLFSSMARRLGVVAVSVVPILPGENLGRLLWPFWANTSRMRSARHCIWSGVRDPSNCGESPACAL